MSVGGPGALRRFVLPALFVIALFLAVWVRRPGGDAESSVVRLSGPTMGTAYHVTAVIEAPGVDEAAIRTAVDEALGEVDDAMSTYKPGSALSRFNRHAETAPFAVPPALIEVVALAQQVSAESDGAFDVTVGPLVRAWGFGPDDPGAAPTVEVQDALRARVGWRKLTVDARGSTLSKSQPDVDLDLSAIAKGYGVDQAATALDRLGLTRYLVEVGGEVVTRGANPEGEPWRVGIEKPAYDGGGLQEVVALSGRAMATSGDYRNYREVDGRRVSHTIDPRTGRPIEHRLASVSVIATRCAVADAWATALNVLGPEAGLALARERDLAALMIVRTESGAFEERATPAFEAFRIARPD